MATVPFCSGYFLKDFKIRGKQSGKYSEQREADCGLVSEGEPPKGWDIFFILQLEKRIKSTRQLIYLEVVNVCTFVPLV